MTGVSVCGETIMGVSVCGETIMGVSGNRVTMADVCVTSASLCRVPISGECV